MPITRLNHAVLYVGDVQRSVVQCQSFSRPRFPLPI